MPLTLTLKPFAITTGKELVLGSSLASLTGATVTTGYQIGIQWQGGALKLNGLLQAASESVYTYFSYDDFNAGKIKFTADGSATPDFSFALRDGSGAALLAQPAIPQIVYKHVNQAPVLAFDLGSIAEGQLKAVTADMISLSDVDTPEDQLGEITLKVAKISGGKFLLNGQAATSFTYADVQHGIVSFQHDGQNAAPFIAMQAIDAALKPTASTIVNASLQFSNITDAPTIQVLKPALVKLGVTHFDAVTHREPIIDIDDNGNDKIVGYDTIIDIEAHDELISGRVALSSLVKISSTEVSLDGCRFSFDVNDCRLVYQNESKAWVDQKSAFGLGDLSKLFIQVDSPGSGTLTVTPTWGVAGSGPSSRISVYSNDPRTYDVNGTGDNTLYSNLAPIVKGVDISSLAFGGSLILGSEFWVADYEKKVGYEEVINDNGDLVGYKALPATTEESGLQEGSLFTVSGMKGCVFKVNGQIANIFSLSELNAGVVEIVHLAQPGITPSFSVAVKDPQGLSSKALAVEVSAEIGLAVKTPLAISEGLDFKLSPANLLIAASKARIASGFEITVLAAECGSIGLYDAVNKIFTSVTSFSYADLKAGKVVFRHNGGDSIPSLLLQAENSTQKFQVPFTFKSLDDAPILELNALAINLGESRLLDRAVFAVAFDEELPQTLQEGQIVTVKSSAGLVFKMNGVEAASFSLIDVSNQLVAVTRTQENASAGFTLTDLGGKTSILKTAAVIARNPANLATPELHVGAISVMEGRTLTLRTSQLNLSDADSNTPDYLLWFRVEKMTNCSFINRSTGQVINHFTLADIKAGRIDLRHDGSKIPPKLSMSWGDESSVHSASAEIPLQFEIYDAHESRSDNVVAGNYFFKTMPLADGGWLISWNEGGSYYVKHFSADGVSQVKSIASPNYGLINVIGCDDGNWMKVWLTPSGVFQQRFGSDDGPISAATAILPPVAGLNSIEIARLANGNFILTGGTFDHDSLDQSNILWQLNTTGQAIGNSTVIKSVKGGLTFLFEPKVAALASGGWVSLYAIQESDTATNIYQQIFTNDGKLKMNSKVNVATKDCSDVQVTTLADGGWLVTWSSWANEDRDIYQRRFDFAGKPIGVEVRVNAIPLESQYHDLVTALVDGGWVVVWESQGANTHIYQRQFSRDGVPQQIEQRVDIGGVYQYNRTQLISLTDGGWVVSWEKSDGSIVQQRYSSDGKPVSLPFDLSGNAIEGGVLTDASTPWLDEDGAITIAYQWQVSEDGQSFTDILGAHSKSYSIPVDNTQVGQYLRLKLSTLDPLVGSTSHFSESRKVADASGILLVSGRAEEGGSLTANTADLLALDPSATFAFHWQTSSDGINFIDIVGATSSDYTIPADQSLVDTYLRLRVVSSSANGSTNFTSTPQLVINVDDAVTGTLHISGTAEVGGTLGMDLSQLNDADGALSFAYQWQLSRNGTDFDNIDGARSTYYVIPNDPSLVGQYLRLYVVTTDALGGNTVMSDVRQVAIVDHESSRDALIKANTGHPSLTNLLDGGWLVTWRTANGIYWQRYDREGALVGKEAAAITPHLHPLNDPSVTLLADGGWLLTWCSIFTDLAKVYHRNLYQQRFASDGTPAGAESQVNSDTSRLTNVFSVTALSDGGWIVTWDSSTRTSTDYNVYQRRYDSNGDPTMAEMRFNTILDGDQDSPSVAALKDGGWVVTWESKRYPSKIYQQCLANDGSKSGQEIVIINNGQDPDVTGLADGGWVTTYSGYNGSTGRDVYLQRFTKTGDRIVSDLLVNTTTHGDQHDAEITALVDGGWVVTWLSVTPDGREVSHFQQRYANDGTRAGGETRINNFIEELAEKPEVTSLNDGGWLVTWRGLSGIAQKRFDADGQIVDIPFALEGAAMEGGTLTAPKLKWYDADGALKYSYQWQVSADGKVFTDIAGATTSGYTLADDDSQIGLYLRQRLTTTDLLGGSTVHDSGVSLITNAGDGNYLWKNSGILDAGAGTDRIRLEGDLNLVTLADGTLKNFEKINLAGHSLTLDLQAVIELSTSTDQLTLEGSGTVSLGTGWIRSGSALGYTNYTQGNAILLVDTDITIL